MEKEREKFTTGVVEQGYDQSLAVEMFDIIAQFADYAFNKSHSYGYGYVAYQIAYLKANHPVEYLSALLTSVKSKLESAAVYLNECRLMGIDVEVPDINRSEMDFTPVPNPDWDGGPYAEGMTSGRHPGQHHLRNVGDPERRRGHCREDSRPGTRVALRVVHRFRRASRDRGAQQAHDRVADQGRRVRLPRPSPKGLLQVYEQIIDLTVQRRKEHDMGVMSLFGELDDGPSFDERPSIPDVEFDKMPRLRTKRRCSASTSPTIRARFEAQVRRKADTGVAGLPIPPTERSSRSAGSSRISSASGPARAI